MATRSKKVQDTATSDGFFQKLAVGVPGILFTYWLSADGNSHHFPFISEHVQALFGVDSSTLNENADVLFSIIHPEDAVDMVATIRESTPGLKPWRYRARLKLKNGRYKWFEVDGRPERQPDGSTIWYGQFHNIQHYKNLEQSLREREAEFSFQAGFQKLIARLSSEFINHGFGTIDQCIDELLRRIGEFFEVDRAYLYGFTDDYKLMTNTHEWCRQGVPSLIDSQQEVCIDDFHWWHEQIGRMVEGNRVLFIEDVESLPGKASPERILLQEQGVSSMFCAPVRVRGKVTGFFGVDSLNHRHWRKDQGDLLIIVSGLLSGALDRHRLEEMLSRSDRLGENFALAVFDIDRFKGINDSIGHLGGDRILQRFADILVSQTRQMDVVARFGGEEFIVVFDALEPADVRQSALRILEAVRNEKFDFNEEAMRVTVSAGIASTAEFTDGPPTPDALISRADCRLYLAKDVGRDCMTDASGTVWR